MIKMFLVEHCVVLERREVVLTKLASHLPLRKQVSRVHCPLKVLLQNGQNSGLFF